MTAPLLRRRFGHGAAKLPIGGSLTGPSLSEIARAPVAREVGFALGPGFVCVAVGLLIATATRLDLAEPATLAETRAAEIEMRLWSETSTPREAPKTRPAPIEIATPSTDSSEAPPAAASEPRARPFDPASLAMRAPLGHSLPDAAPPSAQTRRARVEPGRPIDRSTARARPPLAIPTPLAAPVDSMSPAEETAAPVAAGTNAPRPIGSANGSSRLAAGDRPGWTPDADRRAFLVAQESARDDATGSREARDPRPRPPVSAASRDAPVDLDWDALRAGGWHEVPLDELPDCTPAGRQDVLKKRILVAAPFERECSHPDGSYRFVETRNLGAFLMWSRPNPDRPAASGRDRDVCDVLERALRCLGGSSIEESTAR